MNFSRKPFKVTGQICLMTLGLVTVINCSGEITTPEFGLPRTYSVDPAFSANQQEIIDDVISSWCEATGYCPVRIATDGGSHIVADFNYNQLDYFGFPTDAYTCPPESDADCVTNWHYIRMESEHPDTEFWRLIAHERGHLVIPGHTEFGLMSNQWPDGDRAIDDDAVTAWLENR